MFFLPPTTDPPPPNEWFPMEIIVQAQRITVLVNGLKVSEATDRGSSAGKIGFQLQHVGTIVNFRKLQINELP